MKLITVLATVAATLVGVAQGNFTQPEYGADVLDRFLSARCTNLRTVNEAVGFPVKETTPYPSNLGYDVVIEPTKNCYLSWNEKARESYELLTLTPAEAESRNGSGLVYMTHKAPCGSCSTLDNLYVYLTVRDLTTPVRACIQANPLASVSTVASCIEDIGFKKNCAYIWVHNSKHTAARCASRCVDYANSPNIEETAVETADNFCDPTRCENTINGEAVCIPNMYLDNPFRLNPCLQCDECRSGPIFQKVAGRTRRGSGIESAIPRPGETVTEITHYYGIGEPVVDWVVIGAAIGGGVAFIAIVAGLVYYFKYRGGGEKDVGTDAVAVVADSKA